MSFQVDTALVKQYRSDITLLSQQQGSRLRDCVRRESQNAEFQFFDRIDAVTATKRTTRHGDTPLTSTPHDRRRVGFEDYELAELVDAQDLHRMLANPESAYVKGFVNAIGRAKDTAIITAATGTAYTGKDGGTPLAFADDDGTEVAVDYVESGAAANSNLTIGKLRKAKSILGVNEAVEDGEPLYAIVAQSQIDSLLRTTEVTSADYNVIKALVNGTVDSFMGFQFKRTQLAVVASNIRDCIFYAKNGLLLTEPEEMYVRISERADKSHSMQVYVRASFGSVRMEGKKVVRVKCDETV